MTKVNSVFFHSDVFLYNMKFSSLKMNEKLSQILKNYIFIIKAEIKQMKGEMSPIEVETGLKLMRLQQIFQFNNTIINQVFKHFAALYIFHSFAFL
jgi:hypothetical protein